ncbi:hypothetical protein O1D97_03985 [Marinomonas sp. 15G1-11]|uniref:Aminomethyltransferase folate-binding domain-containing protein n=1 Tax=Marinomonas phaeophyticola TaxID=3004091 RepID=A0ABT4JR09_9GAMM|nr:hypothetical protein [Marinomonas sp. 15G1-11]MCZ2720822.1 hypothetical protein [Marinomonas sp. 15G1-11]
MSDLFTSLKDEFTFPFSTQRSDLGILQFDGVDSNKFLQGQTTCDLSKLTSENALLGAICNLKGQVVSNFYLIKQSETILMVMKHDLVEKTHLHLKKFAVFFKTTISDASQAYILNSMFYTSPTMVFTQQEHRSTITKGKTTQVLLQTSPIKHLLTLTPSSLNPEETGTLKCPLSQATPLLSLFAEPLITLKDSERFLPNMLNMQFTDGISFKKGCYTGQEIVARVHYRGKTKKRLYLASLDQAMELSQTDIQTTDAKPVGDIIESASLNGKTILLAVITISDTDSVLNIKDQTVNLHDLPYSIE